MKISLCVLLLMQTSAVLTAQVPINERELETRLLAFWSDVNLDKDGAPGYEVFSYGGKEVVFFGTDHTVMKATDRMFFQMDSLLSNFNPSLIMVESYTPMVADMNEAATNGDAAFCNYWGAVHQIPVLCWSRDWLDVYNNLTLLYSPEEAFLLLVSQLDAAYYYNWKSYVNYEDYYRKRVSSMDFHGIVVNGYQRIPAYYYQLYNKYYGLLFHSAVPPNGFSAQLNSIGRHSLFREGTAALQMYRDMQLIQSLRDALDTHDRIFIQAGYTHLSSLRPIIFSVIRETVKGSIKASNESESRKVSSKEILQDNHSLLWITDAKGRFQHSECSHSDILDSIETVYDTFKPDLVLVQGNAPVRLTDSLSLAYSGINGLCRSLGVRKSIPQKSWVPTWYNVYYQLSKQFTYEEIYLNAFIFQYVSYREAINPHNFVSNDEVFEWIYASLWSTGFPFQPRSSSASDYLFQLLNSSVTKPKNAPDTYDEFIDLLEVAASPELQRAIRHIYSDHLCEVIARSRDNYRYIIVQADSQYQPMK